MFESAQPVFEKNIALHWDSNPALHWLNAPMSLCGVVVAHSARLANGGLGSNVSYVICVAGNLGVAGYLQVIST